MMNLQCCINKIHLICKNSYYVCPLQTNPEDIEGAKLACYECISNNTDYSGSFKCTKCDQTHQIKQIKDANQIYDMQLESKINEIAKILFDKLLNLNHECKGRIKFNMKPFPYQLK